MSEIRDFFDARMAEALARQFDSSTILAGVAKATEPPPADVYKRNSIAFRMSDDMAVAYGLIPDPRPAEAIEAERAESRRKRAEAEERTAAFVAAVDAIDDPLSRIILDLHGRGGTTYVTCTGCDFSGYEGEPPEWPCSTVAEVAEFHGIEPLRWAAFPWP